MIQTISSVPYVVFGYLKRAITWEGYSLPWFGLVSTWSIGKVIDIIVQDVPIRSIVIPLFLFGTMFLMYIMVTSVDFYTGLRASRKEFRDEFGHTRGYILSEKLWSSIWKFGIVLMIGSILTVFSLIFAVIGWETWNAIFYSILVGFYIVVISFDIHSIGENQRRRFGRKNEYFEFIDEVFTLIRKGIIGNVLGFFKALKNNKNG